MMTKQSAAGGELGTKSAYRTFPEKSLFLSERNFINIA